MVQFQKPKTVYNDRRVYPGGGGPALGPGEGFVPAPTASAATGAAVHDRRNGRARAVDGRTGGYMPFGPLGNGGGHKGGVDTVDDVKPRFQLQSGPVGGEVEETELSRVLIGVCSSVGVVFLALSWFTFGLLNFVCIWLALSLIIGPFAPSPLTGGNCRVGSGELLPDPEPVEEVSTERIKGYNRRSETKPTVMPGLISTNGTKKSDVVEQQQQPKSGDWTGEEIELLRKQLAKHPRGTLQRWEVVAEVFGGSHSTEDVIKMSKLLGEKKFTDGDSYAKFLAQRKGGEKQIDSPLSQRWEGDENAAWTEVEDKALVSALKTFPKDTLKRWDKVADAVPSRSKVQCFKRFSELRESFRNSKADQTLE